MMIGVQRVLAVVFIVALAGCSDPKPEAAKPAAESLEKGAEPAKADKQHDKPSSGPDGQRKPRFELGACDAGLRHGDDLKVASDVAGKDPLRKIELVEVTQAEGTKPAAISITVHERTDKTKKLGEWAQARHAAPAQTIGAKIGNLRVSFTQVPGAPTKTDILTFGCEDKIVEISVPFTDPASPLRKRFSRLVSTLKVGETRLGEGCRKEGDKDCASPMLPACTAGKWSCVELKKEP